MHGTTTYAEHYVRWGIIAHIVHNTGIVLFSDGNTLQSEQFQIKIRHDKFQCKLLKPPPPKKNRQICLDGYYS